MPKSFLNSKGQTTIPKYIREYLNLRSGNKIDFVVNEKGQVILIPVTSDIRDLEGILHKPGIKTVSVEEMNQSIKQRFIS